MDLKELIKSNDKESVQIVLNLFNVEANIDDNLRCVSISEFNNNMFDVIKLVVSVCESSVI